MVFWTRKKLDELIFLENMWEMTEMEMNYMILKFEDKVMRKDLKQETDTYTYDLEPFETTIPFSKNNISGKITIIEVDEYQCNL